MKFEIDIDLPESVLQEWEPVAFRVPKIGETFVMQNGNPHVMPCDDTRVVKQRLILRRRFQWPEWLKCRYLVWDKNGSVSGCDSFPEHNSFQWFSEVADGTARLAATRDVALALGIPFPGGDWTTRIEENPTWKDAT